ncbi:uncharacterized protein LOC141902728 isoform X2 [Tubulanus polymorphus]|uniref:uncharacterized protein LOC141902728 isoform X2 n=1 Tax=Tubulanus polymorphus TaxID=672921 RepID=UPI003DA22B54
MANFVDEDDGKSTTEGSESCDVIMDTPQDGAVVETAIDGTSDVKTSTDKNDVDVENKEDDDEEDINVTDNIDVLDIDDKRGLSPEPTVNGELLEANKKQTEEFSSIALPACSDDQVRSPELGPEDSASSKCPVEKSPTPPPTPAASKTLVETVTIPANVNHPSSHTDMDTCLNLCKRDIGLPMDLSTDQKSQLTSQKRVNSVGISVSRNEPLDLSHKSSRKHVPAKAVKHTVPKTKKDTNTMSPALVSLQQKFGGNAKYLQANGINQRNNSNFASNHFKVPQYQFANYNKHVIDAWYKKPSSNQMSCSSNSTVKATVATLPTSLPNPSISSSSSPRSVSPAVKSMTTKVSTSSTSKISNFTSIMDSKLVPDSVGRSTIDFGCDCNRTFSSLYELSVHMQETGHMPKYSKTGPSGDYPKLVRGQDMWLNNGSEQTKEILRCMQCGESFKTLPELTVHMMKTQHYADIFSSAHRKLHKCTTFFEKESDTKSVFKCRVCEMQYDSLDALANHMVESKHHKRQNWRYPESDSSVSQRVKSVQNLNKSVHLSSTQKCSSPSSAEYETAPTPPHVNANNDTDDAQLEKRSRLTVASLLEHRDHVTKLPENDFNHNSVSSEEAEDNVNNELEKENRSPKPVKEATARSPSSLGCQTPLERPDSVSPKTIDNTDTLPPKKAVVNDMCKIQCENCFARINTDLFVEHVRNCINKKTSDEVINKLKATLTARTQCSTSEEDDDDLESMISEQSASEKVSQTITSKKENNSEAVTKVDQVDGDCSPSPPKKRRHANADVSDNNRISPRNDANVTNKESGSALQAMEHFIANFNEKTFSKSRNRHRYKSSLLYNPHMYGANPFMQYQNMLSQRKNVENEHEHKNASIHLESNGINTSDKPPLSIKDSENDNAERNVTKNEYHSPIKNLIYSPNDFVTPEKDSGSSALQSLFKFATMDPRNVGSNSHSPHWKKAALDKSRLEDSLYCTPRQNSSLPGKMCANDSDERCSSASSSTSETVENSTRAAFSHLKSPHRKSSPPSPCLEKHMSGGNALKRERKNTDDGAASEKIKRVKHNPSNVVSDLSRTKYLTSDDAQVELNKKSASSSWSALSSLKNLVTKQAEPNLGNKSVEHPLDSLQKLINQTDASSKSTNPSLQVKLGSVANAPYWFAYSYLNPLQSGLTNQNVPPKSPDVATSRQAFSPSSDGGHSNGVLDLSSHKTDRNGGHPDSDDDTKPSDLKCDMCGKVFSSKGGCRYHRSKCLHNIPRGMGVKEARIVRTPYTYMPLEHTNKFSKYYEMAKELANKGK